jgi:hypothetical protein
MQGKGDNKEVNNEGKIIEEKRGNKNAKKSRIQL